MMTLSKYITSTLMDTGDQTSSAQRHIIYSSISNVTVVVSEEILEHLANNHLHLVEEGIKKELENAAILIPADTDELAGILSANSTAHGAYSLFLNFAPACQTGCSSCSSKQEYKEISDSVRNKLTNYIESELTAGLHKSFCVTWNITHPAKELPTIISLAESHVKISDQHNLLFTATMICDGASLTRDLFEQLFYQGHISNFHIALNGNDKAAIEATLFNLSNILDHVPFRPQEGIIFEIHIHISTFQQEEVIDIIDKFAASGTQNRVTFQFDADGQDETEISMDEIAAYEIEYLFYAIQKGFIIGVLPARKFVPCAAVDKNAVTIDLQGTIYSCHALSSANSTLVAQNTIGKLDTDSLKHTPNTKFRKWLEDIKYQDTPCANCNLLPICGGGCRLKWEQDKNGCPSFKYNIEDRLVLSYLNQKTFMNELIMETMS